MVMINPYCSWDESGINSSNLNDLVLIAVFLIRFPYVPEFVTITFGLGTFISLKQINEPMDRFCDLSIDRISHRSRAWGRDGANQKRTCSSVSTECVSLITGYTPFSLRCSLPFRVVEKSRRVSTCVSRIEGSGSLFLDGGRN
jgi:hypothetical protein